METSKIAIDALLTSIAKKHLWIDSLEERKSDSLDFYEVSVWSIRYALEAAYKAGKGELK